MTQPNFQGLDWLLQSIPGTPGTDYPILAEVPETKFDCGGQIEGGSYFFLNSCILDIHFLIFHNMMVIV